MTKYVKDEVRNVTAIDFMSSDGWISAEEKVPDNDKSVLVWYENLNALSPSSSWPETTAERKQCLRACSISPMIAILSAVMPLV